DRFVLAKRLKLPLCLRYLNQNSIPLATTATNSCDAKSTATTLQLINQCQNNAGTTSPNRMAEGNCSTVDIDFFRINLSDFMTGERYCCECFIDFKQIDVVFLITGFLQKLIDHKPWCFRKVFCLDRNLRMAEDSCHRCFTHVCCLLIRHDNKCTRSVVHTWRISSRNRAICVKYRWQFGQFLWTRILARPFISIHNNGIAFALWDFYGYNFLSKLSVLNRLQ